MSNKIKSGNNLAGTFILAAVLGAIFIVGHLGDVTEVMASATGDGGHTFFNISNLSYCLLCIAHVMLPASIVALNKTPPTRDKVVRIVCYVISASYFLGNSWIISWLFTSITSGQLSFDVAQFQREYNMMFNHLQWASRNPEVIFYNYFMSVMWLGVGYYLNCHRRRVCKYMLTSIIFKYIAPVVIFYIYRGELIGLWWIQKSLPLICSEIIVISAFFYMSSSRYLWKRYVYENQLRVGGKSGSHKSHKSE